MVIKAEKDLQKKGSMHYFLHRFKRKCVSTRGQASRDL